MSLRLSWNRAIPAYASRLGASGARHVAEHVLVLSLFAAYARTRTPAEVDVVQVQMFVATLPRHMRRRARRAIGSFVNYLARRPRRGRRAGRSS